IACPFGELEKPPSDHIRTAPPAHSTQGVGSCPIHGDCPVLRHSDHSRQPSSPQQQLGLICFSPWLACTPPGKTRASASKTPTARPEMVHSASPWFEGTPPWPWPIADRKPLSFIRLSEAMPSLDVGSVIAQLVSYNQLDVRHNRCTARMIDLPTLGMVSASNCVRNGG